MSIELAKCTNCANFDPDDCVCDIFNEKVAIRDISCSYWEEIDD